MMNKPVSFREVTPCIACKFIGNMGGWKCHLFNFKFDSANIHKEYESHTCGQFESAEEEKNEKTNAKNP